MERSAYRHRVAFIPPHWARVAALLLVCMLLFPARTTASKSPAAPLLWTYECVTCANPPNNGHLVSLGVDPQGYAHLAYESYTSAYGLSVAYQDSAGWHFDLIIERSCGTKRPFVVIAPDGYEHIFYQCGEDSINYSYRDMNGWHAQQIFDTNDFIWHLMPANMIDGNDFALDSSGHVQGLVQATFNRETYLVYYVSSSDAGWQVEEVGYGEDGALALDENDNPYVAHAYRTWEFGLPIDSFLDFSYRDDQGWHTEQLAHPPQGLMTAIAVDSTNQPHIVTNGGIEPGNYYRRDGTTWEVEPVPVGDDPILLLNGQDLPSILSDSSYNLMYAIRQPEGWRTGGLGNMVFAGKPGMALDGEGKAYFAYREDGTYHVMLVRPYTGPVYSFYLPVVLRSDN